MAARRFRRLAGRLAGRVSHCAVLEIGKAAIGFYIGKQGLESTYGAAASIVVVLIWVYYTSQIILMGAEVTHNYAKHNGSFKRRDPDEAPENLRPLSQSRPARNRERRSSSRTG